MAIFCFLDELYMSMVPHTLEVHILSVIVLLVNNGAGQVLTVGCDGEGILGCDCCF